ncbi:hypothetical protein [Kitasatospora aureofaciens]|uniref:hypothetical protein n=1 Tax=Kitasatospora aureofaciens TaxID=1894 RepID=UPI00340E6C5E
MDEILSETTAPGSGTVAAPGRGVVEHRDDLLVLATRELTGETRALGRWTARSVKVTLGLTAATLILAGLTGWLIYVELHPHS